MPDFADMVESLLRAERGPAFPAPASRSESWLERRFSAAHAEALQNLPAPAAPREVQECGDPT